MNKLCHEFHYISHDPSNDICLEIEIAKTKDCILSFHSTFIEGLAIEYCQMLQLWISLHVYKRPLRRTRPNIYCMPGLTSSTNNELLQIVFVSRK